MRSTVAAHARRHVVGYLALFVALSGTSYAAATRISGSQLKNRSVAGVKLKKHTIGGTEINARRLGTVPQAAFANRSLTAGTADLATNAGHAGSADNATAAANAANASHAGGADSVDGVQVAHGLFTGNANAPQTQVLTLGGLVVSAACDASGEPVITFSSNQNHVTWRYQAENDPPTATFFATGNSNDSSAPSQAFTANAGAGQYRMTILYSMGAISVTGRFVIEVGNFGNKDCAVGGDAFQQ